MAVVKVDSKTDTKGQAKLTLNAAKITTLVGVTASTPNKSYKVVLSVAGQNVEKADVYWIEAKPQFTPSVNEKPETGKKVTGKCTPEVGSNWEYGFTLQDETLVGGVFDGCIATISDANIALSVVKNADKTSNVATVNTNTGKNGMATATSTKSGYTTFEATVDGSAVAGKTVKFTVKKGNDTKGTFTSVGTGKTAFTNKQDLEVNWTTKGLTAAFDTANGTTATTSGAFDLYFRVADTYGNKGKDQTVDVTSDMKSVLGLTGATGSNSSKNDVYTAKTDANGLVKISVPSTGKKAGDKEIITATVDNVAYTTIITWTNAAAATIDTTRDENGHYYTNWDGNTITLTFDQDILASSVDASQFTATYGTDKYAIESATVNGNVITLKIKNGPASTSIDKTYSVDISSITNNGVVVSVKTVNGASVPTSVPAINNVAK